MAGKVMAILGGGVGGVVAANTLRRLVPQQHRVVLIEKDTRHAFAPSFLWVMVGQRRPGQVVRDLRTLVLEGVEVVEAEVLGLDLPGGRVETTRGPVKYDYLVISLGAELAPETIPGLAETALTFYTLDGSARLHQALPRLAEQGGTVAVTVSALPYKCPGAPHEAAMLIADYFRRRGLGDRVHVSLFTPEPQPMPVAGPALGDAVKEMLQVRSVNFYPLHKLTAVDASARELHFEGRTPVKFDLLAAIPPHRAPRVVREAGLTNEAGWVPVDTRTLRTRHEGVYAIGDVTAIPVPGRWKPDVPLMLPKAGVFAHAQADVVARRIAAEITGSMPPVEFCGDGYCLLESGEGLAGFAFGNFFAEPHPQVELRQLGRAWHWGKVLFEQWWLSPQGLRRGALSFALRVGARRYGIPVIV